MRPRPLDDALRLVDGLAVVGHEHRDHRVAGQPLDLLATLGRELDRPDPQALNPDDLRIVPSLAERLVGVPARMPMRRPRRGEGSPADVELHARHPRWLSSIRGQPSGSQACDSVPTVELRGKTVLLTGATGGLGRAIAVGLAERGATLVLSSRKPDELESLRGGLPSDGHRVVVSDLAEPGAGTALLAEAGELDVLVANAALPASGKLGGFSAEQVQRALRVNLEAPVLMAHELLPRWLERDSGHFVFIL